MDGLVGGWDSHLGRNVATVYKLDISDTFQTSFRQTNQSLRIENSILLMKFITSFSFLKFHNMSFQSLCLLSLQMRMEKETHLMSEVPASFFLYLFANAGLLKYKG